MKVDGRLFKLLEALGAVGLDWLAAEVMEGVVRGIIPVEDEEMLRSARANVFRQKQDGDNLAQNGNAPPVGLVLEGEAQIDWAISHVTTRLSNIVEMMDESVERLDDIVDRLGLETAERLAATSTLVLSLEDGAPHVTDRAGLQSAAEAVSMLSEALEEWRLTWAPEASS